MTFKIGNANLIAQEACFKGSLHSHVSAEPLQNRKESGMEWKRREKMDLTVRRNHSGKMTNKTHTDAWKMMKLYYLEPDCVLCTFEFIISSFRFVSNQSEYIRTIRLESRVE